MLYAILCYNCEEEVGAWTKEQDDAVMGKLIAVQELSPSALAELVPAITTLARVEGLEAHARSVEVRCTT